MKKKLTLSQLGDILSCVAMGLISFLLLRNVYFSIASLIISLALVVALLVYGNKLQASVQKKLSSYTFFSSFIRNISCTENVKLSYENSVRYLNGYQNIVPFEELEDQSVKLFRYDSLFSFILEKNRENEALLLYYAPLVEEVKQTRTNLDDRLKRIEKQKNETTVFQLLLALLLALFLFFSPIDEAIYATYAYLIPSSLLLALSLPTNYLIYVLKLKGEDENA